MGSTATSVLSDTASARGMSEEDDVDGERDRGRPRRGLEVEVVAERHDAFEPNEGEGDREPSVAESASASSCTVISPASSSAPADASVVAASMMVLEDPDASDSELASKTKGSLFLPFPFLSPFTAAAPAVIARSGSTSFRIILGTFKVSAGVTSLSEWRVVAGSSNFAFDWCSAS